MRSYQIQFSLKRVVLVALMYVSHTCPCRISCCLHLIHAFTPVHQTGLFMASKTWIRRRRQARPRPHHYKTNKFYHIHYLFHFHITDHQHQRHHAKRFPNRPNHSPSLFTVYTGTALLNKITILLLPHYNRSKIQRARSSSKLPSKDVDKHGPALVQLLTSLSFEKLENKKN